MATEGEEGIYASATTSDTGDRDTRQGLTLSPKTPIGGSWLQSIQFAGQAECSSFDDVYGPVESNQEGLGALDDAWIHDLMSGYHATPETTSKKRKVSSEHADHTIEAPTEGGRHGSSVTAKPSQRQPLSSTPVYDPRPQCVESSPVGSRHYSLSDGVASVQYPAPSRPCATVTAPLEYESGRQSYSPLPAIMTPTPSQGHTNTSGTDDLSDGEFDLEKELEEELDRVLHTTEGDKHHENPPRNKKQKRNGSTAQNPVNVENHDTTNWKPNRMSQPAPRVKRPAAPKRVRVRTKQVPGYLVPQAPHFSSGIAAPPNSYGSVSFIPPESKAPPIVVVASSTQYPSEEERMQACLAIVARWPRIHKARLAAQYNIDYIELKRLLKNPAEAHQITMQQPLRVQQHQQVLSLPGFEQRVQAPQSETRCFEVAENRYAVSSSSSQERPPKESTGEVTMSEKEINVMVKPVGPHQDDELDNLYNELFGHDETVETQLVENSLGNDTSLSNNEGPTNFTTQALSNVPDSLVLNKLSESNTESPSVLDELKTRLREEIETELRVQIRKELELELGVKTSTELRPEDTLLDFNEAERLVTCLNILKKNPFTVKKSLAKEHNVPYFKLLRYSKPDAPPIPHYSSRSSSRESSMTSMLVESPSPKISAQPLKDALPQLSMSAVRYHIHDKFNISKMSRTEAIRYAGIHAKDSQRRNAIPTVPMIDLTGSVSLHTITNQKTVCQTLIDELRSQLPSDHSGSSQSIPQYHVELFTFLESRFQQEPDFRASLITWTITKLQSMSSVAASSLILPSLFSIETSSRALAQVENLEKEKVNLNTDIRQLGEYIGYLEYIIQCKGGA